MSGIQQLNTAIRQKTRKLSFILHIFLMRKETMSGTILSMKYQVILLSRQNRILPLCLILYFQKERRKMQKLQKMHLQKNLHLHLYPHWRQSKNDHTLQEQGSQHARTLRNQPVHIVTFTCETLSRPGSEDTQYNVELYEKLVNKLFRLFCTMDTHIYRVVKSIVTSFRTINL